MKVRGCYVGLSHTSPWTPADSLESLGSFQTCVCVFCIRGGMWSNWFDWITESTQTSTQQLMIIPYFPHAVQFLKAL